MGFAPGDAVSDALPSLIVAASGLKVVQLLRDAINAGLPKTGPLGTIPPGANPHTPRPHPKFSNAPVRDGYDGAVRVIHPTPRIEPREVIHPTPRVEDLPLPPVTPVGDEASTTKSTNPIQPPWKMLPWPEQPEVVIQTKVIRPMVDLIHKGTLLDLFV